MKIIKEFEDPEYYGKRYRGCPLGVWNWGLGDDGEIYCKSNAFGDRGEDWHSIDYLSIVPPIKEMKKLVKEFGHLLVFL